ncbi:MAG: hypothetical protein AVO35_04470 [Candidatus Aegiribacteria sp. MLS_C]|nr:MAG: hypothetical protein AVO35_04470 [Candidatus Aegiribacteria sp. MLS_C]
MDAGPLRRPEREDVRWLLARLGIIVGIIAICYLVVSAGLNMFNRTLGLDRPAESTGEGTAQDYQPETFYSPESRISLPEVEELPEGPEASWELTPCSLWVSSSSEPVVDSLPEAPAVPQKPLEALFLVKRWAMETGMGVEDLDMVYVFTRLDTIYVDLPEERDVAGLRMTIESRFICFTRLFPLVAGNLMAQYSEGVPLRGIEGVFRQ